MIAALLALALHPEPKPSRTPFPYVIVSAPPSPITEAMRRECAAAGDVADAASDLLIVGPTAGTADAGVMLFCKRGQYRALWVPVSKP